MAFVRMEDYHGSMEIVCFPETWEKIKHRVQQDAVLGIKGNLEDRRGTYQIIAEEVLSPEELDAREAQEVHLALQGGTLDEEDLITIRSICMDNLGTCDVYLHLPGTSGDGSCVIKASNQIKVSWTPLLTSQLENLQCVREVWKE